ncbi:GDSL esterase/lipase [Dirofilaria immitis]
MAIPVTGHNSCSLSGSGRNEKDQFISDVMPTTDSLNVTNLSGSKELIDLEVIVLNWAKQIFDVTKTKAEAKINKKFLQYNINWSHLFNESLEPIYTIGGADVRNVRQSKDEQSLFKSTFTNTTDREQEYSFKTQRSTRSAATIIVEKGVCRGVEMALKLKTPGEVIEANAGFNTELMVMNIGENTIEEELVWGVDSTVRVPSLCETVAELIILEDHQTRKFTIENRMSGRIIVTVTNIKDNNSLVTIIEGKIADIIRGLTNCSSLGFTIENDVVSFTTKGICKFKYGVEQKVKITEHAIRKY